jgi:hypothetical protein
VERLTPASSHCRVSASGSMALTHCQRFSTG